MNIQTMLRTTRQLLRHSPAQFLARSQPNLGPAIASLNNQVIQRFQTSGSTPLSNSATSDALNMNVIRIKKTPLPVADDHETAMQNAKVEGHAAIIEEMDNSDVNLRPDAWTIGQPTRMIVHKLLEKEKFTHGLRELWEEVEQTGMFKSKRHFKHCLKILKSRQRVDVICLGPQRVGSAKLKFSARLTRRGARTYLWFRQSYRNQLAKKLADANSPSDAAGAASKQQGESS